MEPCFQGTAKKKTSGRSLSLAKQRKRLRLLNQAFTPAVLLGSHSEHTVVRSLNRCVERRAQGDGDGIPGIDGIEDAVVPDFRGRIVRARLTPIVLQNWISNCREFLFRQLLPVSGKLPHLYIGQYARRLLRAHHGNLGLWPGEHEARVKGAP